MTTPNLLFLGITVLAGLMCLWAAITALTGGKDLRLVHRAWALTTAALLPPVTLATALAPPLEARWLVAIATLLPLLAITGTWCNVTTVQEQGFFVKMLHLPVFLFNALLAGIYAVRVAQDQFGLDLGTWGTAITGGHALLQCVVGQAGAETDPIWFYLPFLLPLSLTYRWTHTIALLGVSAISTALLGLLVTLMPFAFTRAQSFRAESQPSPAALRPDLSVGVQMPWSDGLYSEETLAGWREDLLGLRVRAVVADVEPAVMADAHLLAQLRTEIEAAKRHGLEVVLTARPGDGVALGSMRELTLGMAKLHWFAAEKLEPDLLVLYTGPFGELAERMVKIGTIDEWMAAIRRGAAEVRQANPRVRVAVSVQSRAPHAQELFQLLRAADSPLDVVGLSIPPTRGTFSEVRAALATLARWLEQSPGPRPVRILETGASPYAAGGELGQWNLLRTMLAFASDHGIESVSIVALAHPRSTLGLVARDGRRRLAYHELQALLLRPAAAPPK